MSNKNLFPRLPSISRYALFGDLGLKLFSKNIWLLSMLFAFQAAQATMLDTSTLYKSCTADGKSIEYGICIGFVAGVASSALPATQSAALALGGYTEKNAALASEASGKVFGCGEGFKVKDTIQRFVQFVDRNPELRSKPAVLVLTQMMAKEYLCPRPATTPQLPREQLGKDITADLSKSPVAMLYVCWGLAVKDQRNEAASDLSKMIGWFRKNNEFANQMHSKHLAYSVEEIAKIKSKPIRDEFFNLACSDPVENLRQSIKNGMFD